MNDDDPYLMALVHAVEQLAQAKEDLQRAREDLARAKADLAYARAVYGPFAGCGSSRCGR